MLEILELQGDMEDKGLDHTGYKEMYTRESIVIRKPCAEATLCSRFDAQKTSGSFGAGPQIRSFL
jgi:hypothetical protein